MTSPPHGVEWFVDAHGCQAALLRSPEILGGLFERIVRESELRTLGAPLWHVFPGEGGVTGLLLLMESHLTCHTFPERGFAAFNLYCCRPLAEWPWADRLSEILGAQRVSVHSAIRGGS